MPRTSYTVELTPEQIETLQELLTGRGWELSQAPYAVFRGKKDNVNVTAYESGKTVVQGKGTEEFIQFILEPEILQEIVLFPDETEETPEVITPHGGIDAGIRQSSSIGKCCFLVLDTIDIECVCIISST